MDTLFDDELSSGTHCSTGDRPEVGFFADDRRRLTYSRAQRDLLGLIPFPGAMIDLDDALHIMSHDHVQPYGQIIVLMNRGEIDVEYDNAILDPPIVLRRL